MSLRRTAGDRCLAFITAYLAVPWLQRLWVYVLLMALRGMNVGASEHATSGERSTLELVSSTLKRTPHRLTVLDVGANIGDWTQMAAEAFGDRAIIHAFEPASDAHAELATRVGALPHVKTHPVGLGAQKETRQLVRPGSNDAGSARGSLYSRGYDRGEEAVESQAVQLVSLADFMQQEKLTKIDFLKLDVEGHELAILRAAAPMIAEGRVGFIQFEYGMVTLAAGGFLKDFFDLLASTHHIHRILPSGLYRMEDWKPFFEIPVCTNYLAIPRDEGSTSTTEPTIK